MTNQELYSEIKELRDELKEVRDEIKVLHKDFYLFKGKAFGFLSLLSVGLNLALDHWFKK